GGVVIIGFRCFSGSACSKTAPILLCQQNPTQYNLLFCKPVKPECLSVSIGTRKQGLSGLSHDFFSLRGKYREQWQECTNGIFIPSKKSCVLINTYTYKFSTHFLHVFDICEFILCFKHIIGVPKQVGLD
uniref:Uncharacterized protein n=1 Tax=Esox lucius TaxID=8010 RepID=A0AAY5L7K2_ESOLU